MTDEPLFDPSVESIPEEIRALLLKEDGTLKRIILYGLSAADIVNNGKAGLDSIIAQLEEMVKGQMCWCLSLYRLLLGSLCISANLKCIKIILKCWIK